MGNDAAEISRRLAQNAEAVCRHYLSNGCREGRTWRVGDVDNTPGRSMAVRLTGPDSGPGASGHFTDFESGEHGDLLDVIARTCSLHAFRDVLDEARRFLSLPQSAWHPPVQGAPPAPGGSPEAARRLFAAAKPIAGTLAEAYLRARGIIGASELAALRFHPHCYHRAHEHALREVWPALVAAVTNLDGTITGILRTWLARDGSGKASLATPRRALGHLLGSGVRFGRAQADVMAAGEGLETMLSLRLVLPAMPMIAALSSAHLAALVLPTGLRRLYVARDNDLAGHRAAEKLGARANVEGIEALVLTPHADDFNTDLCGLGHEALAASLRVQLTPEDVARFLIVDQWQGQRPRQRALVSGPSSQSAAPGLQGGDGAGSG